MLAFVLAVVIGCAILAPIPAVALGRDEENNVDIYRRFNGGVVNITSRAVAYDFFLNPVPTDSSGSGFILDSHGHILTNYHVVKGAQRLEVSLANQTKWPAKVVGADPQTDLAVVVNADGHASYCPRLGVAGRTRSAGDSSMERQSRGESGLVRRHPADDHRQHDCDRRG